VTTQKILMPMTGLTCGPHTFGMAENRLVLTKNGATYNTIRYEEWFAPENWQSSCQFNPAHKLKRTKNVLNWAEKVKQKKQETDVCGREKPEIEKLKMEEMTQIRKKNIGKNV